MLARDHPAIAIATAPDSFAASLRWKANCRAGATTNHPLPGVRLKRLALIICIMQSVCKNKKLYARPRVFSDLLAYLVVVGTRPFVSTGLVVDEQPSRIAQEYLDTSIPKSLSFGLERYLSFVRYNNI